VLLFFKQRSSVVCKKTLFSFGVVCYFILMDFFCLKNQSYDNSNDVDVGDSSDVMCIPILTIGVVYNGVLGRGIQARMNNYD